MSWSLRTPGADRWLNRAGDTWTADPETEFILSDPGFRFPFTPTGPSVPITDESSLFAAVDYLIGGTSAITRGDLPPRMKSPITARAEIDGLVC